MLQTKHATAWLKQNLLNIKLRALAAITEGLCHKYSARPACTPVSSGQDLYTWLNSSLFFTQISLKLTVDSSKTWQSPLQIFNKKWVTHFIIIYYFTNNDCKSVNFRCEVISFAHTVDMLANIYTHPEFLELCQMSNVFYLGDSVRC